MGSQKRQIFFQERDFQQAWNVKSAPSGFFRRLRKEDRLPRQILSETAHFLGGALLAHDFVLFQNGGLPQLERRVGPLIEEILLRPAPSTNSDGTVPMRVCLHLSHLNLQANRMRYWPCPTRAPASVSSMDIGQLEIPPCSVIWNLGEDQDVLSDLVDWVQKLALPWFEIFENERELHRKLFRGEITGIHLDTAMELVISEFGTFEGARFLDQCVLADSEIGDKVRERTSRILKSKERGVMGHDVISNLAALAASYRMIRR